MCLILYSSGGALSDHGSGCSLHGYARDSMEFPKRYVLLLPTHLVAPHVLLSDHLAAPGLLSCCRRVVMFSQLFRSGPSQSKGGRASIRAQDLRVGDARPRRTHGAQWPRASAGRAARRGGRGRPDDNASWGFQSGRGAFLRVDMYGRGGTHVSACRSRYTIAGGREFCVASWSGVCICEFVCVLWGTHGRVGCNSDVGQDTRT